MVGAVHAVVLAGVPRSGSTWVAEVLTADPRVTLVHEPDNHDLNVGALTAKRGLGAFPQLEPGQVHRPMAGLWKAAARGGFDRDTLALKAQRAVTKQLTREVREAWLDRGEGPRWLRGLVRSWPRPAAGLADTRHVLVKTVHAVRMLDWLVEREVAEVAVVRRDGADVVSSWQRLGWRGQVWAPAALEAAGCGDLVGDAFAELAATALVGVVGVEAAARRHDLLVVDYAEASLAPHDALAGAAERLALPFGPTNHAAIDARERSGSGYATNRERGAGLGVAEERLTATQRTTLERLREALEDPTRPS